VCKNAFLGKAIADHLKTDVPENCSSVKYIEFLTMILMMNHVYNHHHESVAHRNGIDDSLRIHQSKYAQSDLLDSWK